MTNYRFTLAVFISFTLLAIVAVLKAFKEYNVRQLPAHAAAATVKAQAKYAAPEFDTTGVPTVPDADPNSISKDNPGFMIDLDGDKVDDLVKLEGNQLSWTKGPVKQHQPVVVLVVNGDVRCYSVALWLGRPALLVWNQQLKGRYRQCLGVNEAGLPYFGGLEDQ